MAELVPDDALAFERVAGIDVGKAEVMVCTRLPSDSGQGRVQGVFGVTTMTRALQELGNRLVGMGIELVMMEATGDYWRTVHRALTDKGLRVWLVNPSAVKHLPGRPKTDKQDAVWLAKIAERGMAQPSFVPPVEIQRLRELTRYRAALVAERTAEKQRVEKVLDRAGIKVSVVASKLFGVSGRAILAALAAGETDPFVLVKLLRGTLVSKRAAMIEALTGDFTTDHQYLLGIMVRRIDSLDTDIAGLDARIDQSVVGYTQQIDLLQTIPGINAVLAAAILAEIGADMSTFPTAKKLTAWAGVAPTVNMSAGRTKPGQTTTQGSKWLKRALGEAAASAANTHTYLARRHHYLARRRGSKRALVATARHILLVIWWMLTNNKPYHDLGPDYQPNRNTQPKTA